MKCLATSKGEVSEEVDSTGDMGASSGVESWRVGCIFASPPPPDWKGPLCLAGWDVVMLSLLGDAGISHVPALPGVLL